ncbi:MAG: hypothetical protein K9L59_03175 [Desulfobacterales bacterium]|nr:hypothetical protein [Desulfobacterales bacterium]
MRMSLIITICFIFLIPVTTVAQEKNVPKAVAKFRDNPQFYKTIRGINYNVPIPTPENIQATLDGFDTVYHEYLRELLKGFIAELAGDYKQAQKIYENWLKIPVHEEQGYYTHLDLARLSLKLGAFPEAKKHLKLYLFAMNQEISAGEGELTDMFFGYAPSGDTLEEMKAHYKNIMAVYEQL